MGNTDQPKLIIDGDWKRDRQAEQQAPAAQGPSPLAVDSDWKNQAQAEKARLAEAEDKQRAEAAAKAGPGGSPQPGGPRGMPPADFNSLVGTLVTNALMYLGAFPDESGRAVVSLEHARFHIDLLQVLAEKTKGNVTADETADLNQALSELRLRFVEITQAVAQAAAKRKAGGTIPGQASDLNFGPGPAGLKFS
jgi:hypothetical protein